MAMPRRKWALITGASPGGMGEAETAAFMKRGINVISTSIDTKAIRYLKPEAGSDDGFVVTMPLDVTSIESINAAVEHAQQLTDGKLDFLVNNAGYAYFSPLLDVDLDKAKKQYDVNVWGVLAVTQAFFPFLRAAKGMVVNQGSVAGLQGFNRPFIGVYSSSKAALLTLSNTMRIEFAPFDVKVVTLVTSAVRTEFFNHKVGGMIPDTSPYVPIKEEADQMMTVSDYAHTGSDRYEVARATIDELLKESCPATIRNGYLSSFIAFMFWILPAWLIDITSSRRGNLDRLGRVLSGEADSTKEE